MSVKSCLVGIDFEKSVLFFTAGEGIAGKLHLQGGSRGSKLYDLKLSLLRRTDYVFVAQNMDRIKTSLHLKLSTMNSEMVASCGIGSLNQPMSLQPSAKAFVAFSLPLPSTLWACLATPNAFTWYALMISGKAGSQYGKRENFILKKDVIIMGNVPLESFPQIEYKHTATYTSAEGVESKMKVTIPKKCGIPGERLPFLVQVLNGGQIGMGGVKAVLSQNIGYKFVSRLRGRHMKTSQTKIIWEGEGGPVLPGGGNKWSGELPIPFLVPTGLGAESCPNLGMTYCLTFSLAGVLRFLVKVEILIGSRIKAEEEGEGWWEPYCSELSKDLSESQYELNWDTASLSSVDSGFYSCISEESG